MHQILDQAEAIQIIIRDNNPRDLKYYKLARVAEVVSSLHSNSERLNDLTKIR